MSTGAQPYEDHTLCKYGICAVNAHTHREDIPLISTEKCGFPPRVSLGIRLPSFISHGPQQRSQRLRTPTPGSQVSNALSQKYFQPFTKWPYFFPLSLNLWGAKQFFFTVGGNKSQTVSNYLKNKTTHKTKQNSMLPIAERLGTTSGSETVLPTSCPNHS